ncbi:C2H2-type zinc finger protein [Haloarculaceae archaeon H-GB2-1]|nr:C2H2-type zinc finger protein [Haloarculaceae archaeon H-GB1-1]MEA5386663.1 C2H2-type zinc finger protein [Haloarculaceae archaeon H-GB11]MEA5408185.1 C2H2-type zinc finger protein [Haloarculaceae archaeon H-GB2-1]
MTDVEYTHPTENGTASHRCQYCGRSFAREDYLALHHGLEHDARLSEDERSAVEEARSEEKAELRKFRVKALGVLVVLYFGLLMAYAIYA